VLILNRNADRVQAEPAPGDKNIRRAEFQLVLGPDREFEDAVAVVRVLRFSTPFAAVFGFGFAVAF
jgi:hypothetical protein